MFRRSKLLLALVGALVLGVLAPSSAHAADALPTFTVRYLGEGTAAAISDTAIVVGSRTDATTGAPVPLVSTAGAAWRTLPLPAGWSGAFPTDVNDAGVVVGVASDVTLGGRRAVRWTPSGAGHSVELLPLLPGEVASYATAVDDAGRVVGARAGILGTPFGFGWLFSDATGLVDLNARYGWFATPNDINDNGVILSGTQTLDLATGVVADVGLSGPTNYNAVSGVAINDGGQIVGQASLRSTSLNIATVFRYTPGAGWLTIAGTSRYTLASDLNAGGDVTYSEQAPGIHLDGQGTYALNDLLDPSARAAGWILTGLAPKINDGRSIAVSGRNTLTGQTGAVLLDPLGVLAPPAAPTGLTATPHPPTTGEPYLSIELSWVNGDLLLTRSYELERRVSGTATWSPVALVPPAQSTFHQDTTVTPGVAYDYRVRAVGVAGPGPWSSTASATAPTTTVATPLRVTEIGLSASLRRGVVTANGTVTVRTPSGAAVRGAVVDVRWNRPDGSVVTATATTSSRGRAAFSTSGSRGTYTLTVTGVAREGYTFDPAGSVLSRSVTR
ncbi:MAG: hypothetical protein MUF83_17515 [Acidimicrobiales bacterium]|jgi:hypothetical protein|nr:hypothetical protein [Acidimicrobiales bacterium]